MNKIIFIPYVKPDPYTSERTPKLLHILSEWNEIVPVSLGDLDSKVFDQKSNKFQRYILFTISEFKVFLKTLSSGKKNRHSIIFAEGSYYAFSGTLASKILNVPAVWDNHGNIRDFGEAVGKSNMFIKLNLLMEKVIASTASKVLVVSEKDKSAYKDLGFDTSKFQVIPTCADMSRLKTIAKHKAREKLGIQDDKKVIFFFGSLNYYPNEDAFRYLINEMMPKLKPVVPNVSLYVAGSGSIENTGEAIMLGYVPDISVWISAADVCVAPLWKGVGILTKVIDIMSLGSPAVVSSLAVDGIPELQDGKNCLIGNRENFHTKVLQVLCDPELGKQIGAEGRQLIIERYSWDAVAPQLKSSLEGMF